MTRVEVLPEGWNVPLCVADCHVKYAPSNEAERVANARLIAAGPTMLDVLIELKVWLMAPDFSAEVLDNMEAQVKTAIAKATGQQ